MYRRVNWDSQNARQQALKKEARIFTEADLAQISDLDENSGKPQEFLKPEFFTEAV